MEEIKNWEILAKYFSGEASKAEKEEVEQYFEATPERQKEFKQAKAIWDNSDQYTLCPKPNIDEAWQKLDHEIEVRKNLKDQDSGKGKSKIIYLNVLWRAAAAIVIIISAYFILQYTNKTAPVSEISYVAEQTANGEKQKITLEDGSTVWINAASQFKYPDKFSNNRREVSLKGEAFFEVSRDPSRPFIVHTETATIQVLGTSFNVKEYNEENTIEVIVKEGKVSFSITEGFENRNNSVILEKGEKGTYLKHKKQIIKETFEPDTYADWKSGYLGFSNESMEEVARKLERWYNVKIRFDNEKIKNCKLTASFHKKDISDVLEIIELALDIHSEKNEYFYTLSGSGC